ncbi:Endoplasmic reticulum chaperone BiP [Mortierella sp. GBA35]|nr:Endoplasmic reticulum chaperone BiP [Mortierella sp. GBA35]
MLRTQSPVVGIDLGNSYSRIGVYTTDHNHNHDRDSIARLISNSDDKTAIPSFVLYAADGSSLVGQAAKDQEGTKPTSTLFGFKQFLGKSRNDPTVLEEISTVPYKFKPSASGDGDENIFIVVDDEGGEGGEGLLVCPEQVYSRVLVLLKEIAEEGLRDTVSQAVITVPVAFDSAQRQAVKDAASRAGFQILRVVSDPVAACVAYGLDRSGDGGTALTPTILSLNGGTADDDDTVTIHATEQVRHFVGDAIDHSLMRYFAEKYKTKTGLDVLKDIPAMRRLKREGEKAKVLLSTEEMARVDIESFYEGYSFLDTLLRDTLEVLISPLLEQIPETIAAVLEKAHLTMGDVEDVVLVSGSSRIPKVVAVVEEVFTGKRVHKDIGAEEVVVHGTALLAARLWGDVISQ